MSEYYTSEYSSYNEDLEHRIREEEITEWVERFEATAALWPIDGRWFSMTAREKRAYTAKIIDENQNKIRPRPKT